MISVNPSNVLNLLWRHFDEYTVTSVVTEREKSLSNVILTLIESAMVSSSPLPCILKYVAAHHSSTSPNTFSPGLSSSPSSSSSYLDSNNFGYNNSSRLKDTTISSSSSMSFRSVTRTESIQSSVKPPTSSGAIVGNKTRPAKPARKSHVSPIQCSSSSNQLSCNNSVGVKSIGSSIQRRQTSDVSASGHGLLTRGDSDLVRGVTTVPVPIPPSNSSSSRSAFRGMFSMNNKKSRSMAVLPTSEDKCGPLNINCNSPTVAPAGIFTRTNTSSFRSAPKTGRFASSNNGFGRNYNPRDVTSSGVNGNKDKNGSKEITRAASQQQQQQQQQVSSSSVSSFAINGKNQPFSYSQPNSTISSVTNKLNASGTGKVSSTSAGSNVTSSSAAATANIGSNSSDANCINVTMSASSSHSATSSSSTHSGINNNSSIRGSAGTPDSNPIHLMAKKKKNRQWLINFLRELIFFLSLSLSLSCIHLVINSCCLFAFCSFSSQFEGQQSTLCVRKASIKMNLSSVAISIIYVLARRPLFLNLCVPLSPRLKVKIYARTAFIVFVVIYHKFRKSASKLIKITTPVSRKKMMFMCSLDC